MRRSTAHVPTDSRRTSEIPEDRHGVRRVCIDPLYAAGRPSKAKVMRMRAYCIVCLTFLAVLFVLFSRQDRFLILPLVRGGWIIFVNGKRLFLLDTPFMIGSVASIIIMLIMLKTMKRDRK